MQVCTGLWVHDNEAAQDPAYIEGRGIQAVLSILSDRLRPFDDNGLCRLRLSPPDGPGFEFWHIGLAVKFLEYVHHRQCYPTLVHCWGGTSRSVSVAATYCYLYRDVLAGPAVNVHDMDECAKQMREQRGVGLTLPHPHIWEHCKRYVQFRQDFEVVA